MADVLERIVADKKQQLAEARRRVPLEDMRVRARDVEPARDFFGAVVRPRDRLRVIAEVKKASPSAGVIREDFDPVVIARLYHDNGAAAISCLTDAKYFQGSLDHLVRIRRAVALPVLRKDFLIDPYQVHEARAAGADAVLLIAECLAESQLTDLLGEARELGMTVLIEVHSVENLQQAGRHLESPRGVLLGINNRDLTTMTTDLDHTFRMLELIDNTEIVVSESGISSHADVQRLVDAGVYRILVGEHLMRQQDIGAALRELIG